MSVGDTVERQILYGNEKAGKTYGFDRDHDPTHPAQMWFQESDEGLVLFLVFIPKPAAGRGALGATCRQKSPRSMFISNI